jgi:hypothetical protein
MAFVAFTVKLNMSTTYDITADRVRKATPDKRNSIIDQKTEENIAWYATCSGDEIARRITELDKEWDIERTLELNASLVALAGIVLALTVNRKWWALPAIVTAFLAEHSLHGWCPPLPLFRSMNIRTRKEIDKEKVALKDLLEKKTSSESPLNETAF